MGEGENDWSVRTKAAQALGWIDERTKAVTPPIHPSTTFIRDPDNQYRAGYGYSRDENPTYDQAQSLLADLEGGVTKGDEYWTRLGRREDLKGPAGPGERNVE